MDIMSQLHAPAALPPAKHPMDRRLGGLSVILDAAVKWKPIASVRNQLSIAHSSSPLPSSCANWNIPDPNNNKTEADSRNIILDMRNGLFTCLQKNNNLKTFRKRIEESNYLTTEQIVTCSDIHEMQIQ
jgi:hypothetical protein